MEEKFRYENGTETVGNVYLDVMSILAKSFIIFVVFCLGGA